MGSDAGSGSSDDEVDESRWPISSSGQGGTGAGSATNSTGDCGSGSSCGRGAAGVSAAIASAVIIIASAAIAVAAVVAEDMGEATSSCRMCWVLSLLARLSTLVRGRDSAGSSRSVPGAGSTGGESRGAGPVVSLGDTPTSSGPEGFTWVPMAKRSNMATVCRQWQRGEGEEREGRSLGAARPIMKGIQARCVALIRAPNDAVGATTGTDVAQHGEAASSSGAKSHKPRCGHARHDETTFSSWSTPSQRSPSSLRQSSHRPDSLRVVGMASAAVVFPVERVGRRAVRQEDGLPRPKTQRRLMGEEDGGPVYVCPVRAVVNV